MPKVAPEAGAGFRFDELEQIEDGEDHRGQEANADQVRADNESGDLSSIPVLILDHLVQIWQKRHFQWLKNEFRKSNF